VSGRFLYYTEVLLRLLPEQDYALTLEALAEALPLEVAATDAQGRVIVWNAALAAVAGPRAGAVGRPLLEAMPLLLDDPNVDWRRLLDAVLAGDEGQTMPRHPLGARVVRATLAPMRGPGGRILGAVLCFEDITRGTREEEQRRFQARADAVAGLGAGIAHEIRNPLNALSLHLQLLREQLEDPGVSRESLSARTDTMIAEVDRMEGLVQNLLEVSHGGPVVHREESLDDVVRTVVDRLAPEIRRREANLELSLASSRPVPMERTSIERALTNIVVNAVDAAGSGGRVWISTRDDPYSSVVVVDDDGPGIPSEARDRVFELFWTSKRGGTGLGLPLARRAVERHGGELEVLDRPGGGSRFVIHLPPEAGASLGR
jgi:signal transduction histidine kinase